MNGERILIDTSIWIDYFQNKSSQFSVTVDDILSTENVYIPKIVIAELIQGARSKKEVSVIQSYFDAFTIIDQKEDTWLEAGKLSYRLRKKGKSINLLDCYIAIIASTYKCKILTLDKHFKDIQTEIELRLYLKYPPILAH
ncbi:MAG: PIN domain-containing protein [Candidatus Scalindua sp.]|nr:PIN domain-containing protein [Candidatus Scalindua sp.]